MDGVICAKCHTWLSSQSSNCPSCLEALVWEGQDKNIIDRLQPDCLVHRYEGSDILEPAVFIREGKTNIRTATKLKEYSKPVTIPKHKVYVFDQTILSAIQALRNERTATVMRYDQLIQSHWQQLKPFQPKQ